MQCAQNNVMYLVKNKTKCVLDDTLKMKIDNTFIYVGYLVAHYNYKTTAKTKKI